MENIRPVKRTKWEDEFDTKTELDISLNESRSFGTSSDVLEYWNANKTRFPILARMARDYLVCQPTSKEIEGNFSKGRRIIPFYRTKQNGTTVRDQMLINSGYDLGIYD